MEGLREPSFCPSLFFLSLVPLNPSPCPFFALTLSLQLNLRVERAHAGEQVPPEFLAALKLYLHTQRFEQWDRDE